MKTYCKENIDPNIPGLILCSHGPLAIGLIQSVEMLAGENPNVSAFCLEPGDDIDKFRNVVKNQLEAYPDGTVVFVDLFGGTPCNQMLQYVQESEKQIEIVTGMNLPMILNAVLSRNINKGNDLSLDSVENGRTGISRINIEEFLSDEDEEDDE